MSILFPKLRRYSIGKTANSSILTTLLQFDYNNLRNTVEYLEIIYITRNESLTYISTADSMVLFLLLFTQLFLKVKLSELRRVLAENNFDMK